MVHKARPQLSVHSGTIRITSAEFVTVRILSASYRRESNNERTEIKQYSLDEKIYAAKLEKCVHFTGNSVRQSNCPPILDTHSHGINMC